MKLLIPTLLLAITLIACSSDDEDAPPTPTSTPTQAAATESPSPAAAATTAPGELPTPIAATVTEDAHCTPETTGKSDPSAGLNFLDGGSTICAWWTPAGDASSAHRVEVTFVPSGVGLNYAAAQGVHSLIVDLDAIAFPSGQDRDRALKDITATFWTVRDDGTETLLDGVAVHRQ